MTLLWSYQHGMHILKITTDLCQFIDFHRVISNELICLPTKKEIEEERIVKFDNDATLNDYSTKYSTSETSL